MTAFRACAAMLCVLLAGCAGTAVKAPPPTDAGQSPTAKPEPPAQTPPTPAAPEPPAPVAAAAPAAPSATPVPPAPVTPPVPPTFAVPAPPPPVPAPARPASVARATPAPAPVPAAKPAAALKQSTDSASQTGGAAAAAKPASTAAPSTSKPVATGAALSGHIELIVGSGQSVDAEEVADAVVYFVPDGGAPHPKPGHFQIYTRDKQFDPASMVIPLGSTVGFPNSDEILHNVFSVTPGSEFDLGLYGEGATAEFTFKKAGPVTVNCNVHHQMQASILVVDTPYFAHPTKTGDFQLSGLPAGAGKLMLWHPRSGQQTVIVDTGVTTPVAMQLTITKARVAPHLNKDHKKYSPSRN